jgi:hypothetical protein
VERDGRRQMAARVCLGALLIGSLQALSASASSLLPPPSFRPSVDWWTLTTGPTDARFQMAPQVWAITARSNTAALVPFDLFNGLKHLSTQGIVIWASNEGRGGITPTFTRARLPLRLASFRTDRMWEGQPAANVQQRLRWASVQGWQLDVRVYFATQHPGKALLASAQAELNRLLLPR